MNVPEIREALLLAQELDTIVDHQDARYPNVGVVSQEAAAAIRRQHARIQELEAHITKLTTLKNEGGLEIRAWDTMKEQKRKIIELEKALESIGAGGVFWAAGYAGRYGAWVLY
mgnify:CR=1 FL=1